VSNAKPRTKTKTKRTAPTTTRTVRAAVELDLKALPADIRNSAIAATALALARELDNRNNSATAKSMCAGKLIEAMEKLRAIAPAKPQPTALDEIAKRRERRLARRAAT
jgi:hypothetical protein